MNTIIIKRVYEEPQKEDGFRVLVDRLWPRGITKDKAKLDIWAKEISPSNELRKEYHRSSDEVVFRMKYLEELKENPSSEEFRNNVLERLAVSNVTLLTSAKNTDFNHCHVIKDWLR